MTRNKIGIIAQATLEFTVTLVIAVALLLGMLSLWKWSSDRIVKRQIDYNASRKEAGTRSPDWPEVAPQLIIKE